MEADLVAAATDMKEAVICSNMMLQLGFGAPFDSVPAHIGNTAAPHVAANRMYSGRTNHVALHVYEISREISRTPS